MPASRLIPRRAALGLASRLALCLALPAGFPLALAQPPASASAAAGGKVVVGGVVPDDATRAAVLDRVRALYGAERVVDQLGVDKLPAPPDWSRHVRDALDADLLRVTQGQLRISGNVVELSGSVDSEAARTEVLGRLAARLDNPTYTVRDGLRVGGPGPQLLEAALAQRTIEFEMGNATLTAAGAQVLDDLLPTLRQFRGRRFEIVGHTDDSGPRDANIALSAARAAAVKDYLSAKGIPAADLVTSGAGPDRPIASNASAQGRARNRRIEFRVLA